MGCGISRMDDSELVSLCRERKKLIKAAVDCRYALASAHISYFQSLLDVGNALNHFVEEELLISVDSVDTLSTADSDHQSLGEGSHLELLSSNSDDTDVISLTDDVHEGSRVYGNSAPQNESSRGVNSNVYSMKRSSEEVPTRFFEQPQAVPTTLQWQDSSKLLGQYSEYGNRAFFCDPMNIPANNLRFSQYENRAALDGPISLPPNNVRFSRYENGASYDGVMNLPPDITQYRNEVSIGGPMNLPPDNLGFYRYGYGADLPNINHRFPLNKNGLSGVSMYSSYDGPYYNQTYIPPTAPWVPPPPEASNWDYLNPFSVVDDTYTRYYSQGGHGIGFGSTDPDLGEVRMREGIPDLEDDTKQNLMEEKPNDIISRINEPNDIGLNTKTRGVSGEGSSEVASPKNDGQVPLAQGKETRTNQDNPVADINVIKTTSDTIEEDTRRESDTVVPKGLEEEEKKNSGTFQVQKSIEEGEFLEQVNSTTLSSHGLRELKEVLKEIKDAFEAAFNYGKEVSVILEAGKLPYQPRGTIFKAFSSWIPRLVAPNMVTSSHPKHTILKRSAYRTVKVAKVYNANLEKDICIKSSNLSSTLEKMYAWEKKLYEEVKVEERLRLSYYRECKKLKELDDRGAENSKIDTTHALIRRLLPKTNVAVSSVAAISKRIHKLRDKELQPQLNELVHGLRRMWKFMVECHRRQFQAMMKAKARVEMANATIQRNSSLKATQKLEKSVLNWGTSFTDWINCQKAFIMLLNGWLIKCLLQEPEETSDGSAPFSPGRLGAPAIFTVCNDWCHTMEKISETGVSKAIHDFATTLHQFWEKLDEERCRFLKAEYLSKDLEKRLKYFCEERGVKWDQYASANNAADSGGSAESVVPVPVPGGVNEELETLRNRFNEERARHGEAIRQVNDGASRSLREGPVLIFKALESFSLEILEAYEQVRIPNEGSTQ